MACNSLIYGSLIIRTLPQEICGAHVFHLPLTCLEYTNTEEGREREREKKIPIRTGRVLRDSS